MGGLSEAAKRITYDPWADAVSFHIGGPEKFIVDYADVDGDAIVHFDGDNRIVALEVLAASQRLDLDFLLPEITLLGDEGYQTWRKPQGALWRYKQAGQPIVAGAKEKTYRISKIENHAVTLIAESSSAPVTISEQDLDNFDIAAHRNLPLGEIVEALWGLGQYRSDSA